MKKVAITGAKGGTGVSIVKLFRVAGYRAVGVDLTGARQNRLLVVSPERALNDEGTNDLAIRSHRTARASVNM